MGTKTAQWKRSPRQKLREWIVDDISNCDWDDNEIWNMPMTTEEHSGRSHFNWDAPFPVWKAQKAIWNRAYYNPMCQSLESKLAPVLSSQFSSLARCIVDHRDAILRQGGLVNIGPGNGLAPVGRHSHYLNQWWFIINSNHSKLEKLVKTQLFAFEKMYLKCRLQNISHSAQPSLC